MNGSKLMLVLACAMAFLAPCNARGTELEDKLTRILTGPNETVRWQAIAALRNDREKSIAALGQLISAAASEAQSTPPRSLVRPSMAELLELIGSTKRPEAEVVLIQLLGAAHTGIAMVAADTLGRNRLTGSIRSLKRQIYRPEFQMSYGFRFNLVRSLARMKHPDALEFLDGLRSQLDGQLRFEVDRLLEQVNESDFQGDTQRFDDWQTAHESKIVLASGQSESEARQRMMLGRAQQYYGIDIQSKRMMFIIDHSGSMKGGDAGITRLDRAKYELVRAIERLPEDAEFGILFYASMVQRWRSELMQATDQNKREAIAFVGRLGFGHQTNTYAALRQALEFDDDLEAVFVLTDGRPTSGQIADPQAIIADIIHRNRFRHLHFNTIGIAVDGPTERFLRTLAELSGGEFRKAR